MNDMLLAAPATDPVCGMQVDPATARERGLTSDHEGQTYFFCGKGCKLDFDENPARFFEEGYQPQM